MENNRKLVELLELTLGESNLPGLGKPVRGKVRDIYDLGDRLLLVTTDRISAFDVVLGTIPCKGQVLNTIATHWFKRTKDLLPNHLIDVPDPSAVVVKKLNPLPVEIVVRRYLTGSLWREYDSGTREIYGQVLDKGMQRDQRFEKPLLTPTTKAEQGQHDQPLSPEEVVARGLVKRELWEEVKESAFALFARGEEEAARRGLILVDTKYEFGLEAGNLAVIDEIHTPDSSRYWELDEYERRYDQGQEQKMLDKENIRQWLLQRGFDGHGKPPELTDEVRLSLARTYLDLQQRLTGREPVLPETPPAERLLANLKRHSILE